MKNKDARLTRLSAILTQLQSKRMVTATELAKKHDVSVRTIYRDIRALEATGIPITVDEGKGYTLVDGFRLPPIMFTEEEANALITAENLISKNRDQSFAKNYSDALLKIKAVLNYEAKGKAELLSKRVIFRTNNDHENTSNFLSKAQKAITSFSLVQLKYQSMQDETTTRVIEPFALYNTQENWILIAYCRLRNDFRAFRLDRIKHFFVTSDCFDSHNFTLQEHFEAVANKYKKCSKTTPDINKSSKESKLE